VERALEILYLVALNSLGHVAFVGARMATALFALHLDASAFQVGVLLSLFAALPMLLSVSCGRLIDRVGPGRPVGLALGVLALAAALPFAFPRIETLYLSSILLGLAFMFVHIAMNSMFGAHGTPEQRATNFSWLAVGFSCSGSLGPLVAGYAIEGFGHAGAFLTLSLFPALAFALLLSRRQPLPRPERPAAPPGNRHVLDLFRLPKLRSAFIVSGVLATGWDLYSFLMPLYGSRIGLSPGIIGLVMAIFAAATFAVRLAMPLLIRRVRHSSVIAVSMAVAGIGYLLFPFASSALALMALSFLLGLGLGAAQPVIMAAIYDASPHGRQAEAVGVRTTMINASQTFIPLASGGVSAALGMTPVFWLLAGLLLAGAWFTRQRIK